MQHCKKIVKIAQGSFGSKVYLCRNEKKTDIVDTTDTTTATNDDYGKVYGEKPFIKYKFIFLYTLCMRILNGLFIICNVNLK